MTRISDERWLQAQKAEREFHDRTNVSAEESIKKYGFAYQKYFEFLGMKRDQEGKSIMEVGPADYPALYYCHNYSPSYLAEPMPSEVLEQIVKDAGQLTDGSHRLTIIKQCVEDMQVLPKMDEVWLLNVLQHVKDPFWLVAQCQKIAPVIRFFEPIDWPEEIYHPHTFTREDYYQMFGKDVVKIYNGDVPDFHSATCAYGTWIAPELRISVGHN